MEKETFAFIIHPFDTSDLARKFPFAERFSEGMKERFLRHSPPIVADQMRGIRGSDAAADGWLVASTLTARQMVELPTPLVLRKILAAGRKAERLGAQIVGLGAMTSVVGDAGITIARGLNIPVTTGNSYTVATAIQATNQAAALMGINLQEANLCIIGATGAIGIVCARVMAPMAGKTTLVARSEQKLEEVAATIFSESAVLCDTSVHVRDAVRKADVVVAVSGSADVLIEPSDLKPGAVVCDVARPRDVARAVGETRDDVLVIEGGLVEVPGGWEGRFSFGLPKGVVYACMAETMVLALERRYECFTLGRSIQIEQVREIDRLAKKHGFQLAGFRSFERPLSLEAIEAIRARAEQRKRSGQEMRPLFS